MSDVKREIIFQDSMNVDKRNEDFAYLRKNVYPTKTKGLYPSHDFIADNPTFTATENIYDIIGSEEGTFDIKVIIEDASGNTIFKNLGSNAISNTALTAGVGFDCGTFGDDGVHIACDDANVYQINHTSSSTNIDGVFTGGFPDVAGFDGLLYWWVSRTEIYKQSGGGAPSIAFNNLGLIPRFIDFYDDQMIIFAEEANNIIVLFWDKEDVDFFDKRITIKNARLIAGGVVDGTLMLVKAVGNSSNSSEQEGDIIITAYDGQKFAKINSIKGGDRAVQYTSDTSVGVGSEIMTFSVRDNLDTHNTDLYHDYIYKVRKNGSIEVLTLPDPDYGTSMVVRVFYDFLLYGTSGGTNPPAIFVNNDGDSDYDDYQKFTETTYITSFLTNPYNKHNLQGINVAFEKIFEQTTVDTGEYLKISYRVSERDDWTVLGEITPEKIRDSDSNTDESVAYANDLLSMSTQRYMIIKKADGTPLPDFNEIQYKFETKFGFSIIGAWHEYDYTTRAILN